MQGWPLKIFITPNIIEANKTQGALAMIQDSLGYLLAAATRLAARMILNILFGFRAGKAAKIKP